jgi:hypothetical protein
MQPVDVDLFSLLLPRHPIEQAILSGAAMPMLAETPMRTS